MVDQVKGKRTRSRDASGHSNPVQGTISLPWIPGVSTKLKKIYQKAGYKVTFKSNRNLESVLTSKNKIKLPKNSFPGVYKIPCSCGKTAYRGETKKKVSTRAKEHAKYIEDGDWEKSGLAGHAKDCKGTIDFANTETIKVVNNRFDRKVRETLEIQKNDCHSTKGGMNPDKGQYVKTMFWMPLFRDLRRRENKNVRR